ncbi:Annexin [Ancylostoma duodenale]|uniref:Annexin n=1 Tax=Ancylostoma duodenale TaxID=51022 RepID=A0A0C2DLL6_9BILA|nr:Annexin [Ancylostoma duodenale]
MTGNEWSCAAEQLKVEKHMQNLVKVRELPENFCFSEDFLWFKRRAYTGWSELTGISTRDKDLIRVLVSRAEIDLAAIQVEYERLFKKPLLQVIRDECKGAYRDALTSIVKGNRSHSYMN